MDKRRDKNSEFLFWVQYGLCRADMNMLFDENHEFLFGVQY
jgi:hypothetical protein